MKLWVDDVRPAPDGYIWARSTNEAIKIIKREMYWRRLEEISLDHDAGDYYSDGGDYIEILNTLERWYMTSKAWFLAVPINIHSRNPVGVENMRRIIKRNGWKEI